MIKGLEALKRIRPYSDSTIDADLEIIEKELKALEIIKKKRVDIFAFQMSNDLVGYKDLARCWCYELTQEEYDLLKEVFCEK